MELRLPTSEELRLAYRRDMTPAFPRAERKPLHVIEQLYAEGLYRPWCLFDDTELVGEAFIWAFEARYVLFDYLCITDTRRNDGLGSELIGKLLDSERNNIVFGEAEIPAYAPDPAMAERRLGFYRRNGLKKAFYDTNLFGVPYHTLYWADKEVDEQALLAAHQRCYRKKMPGLIFKTCIRIPWNESMGRMKKTDWKEET